MSQPMPADEDLVAGKASWLSILGSDAPWVLGLLVLTWVIAASWLAATLTLGLSGYDTSVGLAVLVKLLVSMWSTPTTPFTSMDFDTLVAPWLWWPMWAGLVLIPPLVVWRLIARARRRRVERRSGWSSRDRLGGALGLGSGRNRGDVMRPGPTRKET